MTPSGNAALAAAAASHPDQTEIDDVIRELASSTSLPEVTSCYLKLDATQRPTYGRHRRAFDSMAQQAERRAELMKPAKRDAVKADIQAIRRSLARGIDRDEVRGLACFSCSAGRFLRVVALPVAVADRMRVAMPPLLVPLELVAEEARRFGVILIDEVQLRIVEARLGALHPYPPIVEPPEPTHERRRGWSVVGSTRTTGQAAARWLPVGSHFDRHELSVVERHVARCAATLTNHLQKHPVDLLILAGPLEMQAHLERALPARLQQVVAARVSTPVRAPLEQIGRMVDRIATAIQDREEDDLLANLEFSLEAGRAVSGLGPVLGALAEARVATLVTEVGQPSQSGAVCSACSRITVSAAFCPVCGAETLPIDDIAEAAVEQARATGARIRVIRSRVALQEADGIAALLRYPRSA